MTSIIAKTQAITTEEDMTKQINLIMQPYANWEEYLNPAPLSIALMGELVLISSKADFSINKNPPKDGYKFINYPESFRACLMQVCSSGWEAFNTAHKNMDQIRLQTAQVPNYMGEALRILVNGADELINELLPDQLDNIREIADGCVQLADESEKRFTDVINITGELLNACINAKHSYGDMMKETEKKLKEYDQRKQTAENAKKQREKAVSTMEKELDQAHKNYQKAMDSLPSGWEMIGMTFVEGLANAVTTFTNGILSAESEKFRMSRGSFIGSTCPSQQPVGDGDWIDEISAYSKSAEILQYAQAVFQQMGVASRDDEIAWDNIYDEKDECIKTDFLKDQFVRIQNELKTNPDSPGKMQAQQLCTKGINVCQQLAKYAPHGKCDKVESTEIIDGAIDLIHSARIFDTKSKDVTNSPAISPKPPRIYEQANSGNTSTANIVMQNARLNIEQSEAQLNKTTERYDKCVENLEQNQKELTEILSAMENCKLEEIDFKTTIEMLLKGMDAMGRVEEQWKKMVHFFQMISSIVKISLSKTLKNFVSKAEKTEKLSYNAKMFSIDLLYTQAFQASNIASLVHMISSTYTVVSTNYLMVPVGSLDKLMALDASDPNFEHERQQLKNSCDKAKTGISSLVKKNKEDFDRKTKERIEKIKQELLPSLPAAPPEQIKSIQEAVQAGFTKEEHHI